MGLKYPTQICLPPGACLNDLTSFALSHGVNMKTCKILSENSGEPICGEITFENHADVSSTIVKINHPAKDKKSISNTNSSCKYSLMLEWNTGVDDKSVRFDFVQTVS
jgi:hypothetical protein